MRRVAKPGDRVRVVASPDNLHMLRDFCYKLEKARGDPGPRGWDPAGVLCVISVNDGPGFGVSPYPTVVWDIPCPYPDVARWSWLGAHGIWVPDDEVPRLEVIG